MIWRRYSRGSENILRFCQDMRSDERRKRLNCNEFHPTPETVFEKLGKRKKAIERLGAREELNKEVNVAVRPGIATKDGTEKGEPGDTKRTNFRFVSRQKVRRLFSGNRAAHDLNRRLNIMRTAQTPPARPTALQ